MYLGASVLQSTLTTVVVLGVVPLETQSTLFWAAGVNEHCIVFELGAKWGAALHCNQETLIEGHWSWGRICWVPGERLPQHDAVHDVDMIMVSWIVVDDEKSSGFWNCKVSKLEALTVRNIWGTRVLVPKHRNSGSPPPGKWFSLLCQMYLCVPDISWFYWSIASMNKRTLPRKLKIKRWGHQSSGA